MDTEISNSICRSLPVKRGGVAGRPLAAAISDIDGLLSLEKAFPEADRISRRSWNRFLRSVGSVWVVRESGAVLAAAVLLFRKNSKTVRIYSLAVAPSERGKGYARRLLEACEAEAGRRNSQRLSLEVRVSNQAAAALYGSFGFAEVNRIAAYYDDGEDALRMTKSIKKVGHGFD